MSCRVAIAKKRRKRTKMNFGNLATKTYTSGRKDLERCFEIDIAKTFKIMQKCFGNIANF
jgi:hypothetical protein